MPNPLIKTFEEKIESRINMFNKFYEKLFKTTPSIALISEIRGEINVINMMFLIESETINTLTELAEKSKKDTDVMHLSNMQNLFDSFSKGCETQIELLVTMIEYIEIKMRPAENTRSKAKITGVTVLNVTNSLSVTGTGSKSKSKSKSKSTSTINNLIVPPKPALVIPSPQPKQITLDDLKIKFILLIERLTRFYTNMKFNETDFKLVEETVTVMGNKITFRTSDVRGDGACGFRAILTSYLITLGILLPYNPKKLETFILELKNCMHELLLILSNNSENDNFINNLLSNPANGSKKVNIGEWFQMISVDSYQCTDGDIRLIAILFGMLPEVDRITQINVLKLRPVEHNPYQSFNCYGTSNIVSVCSVSHINIIHTGGHYRAVMKISGNLRPIEYRDAVINLPYA